MRYLLEYIFLKLIALIASLLPLRLVPRLGGVLGGACFKLFSGRRKTALKNTETAFPDKSRRERRDIVKSAFKHFGRALVETVRFPKIDAENMNKYASYDGLKHIKNAYEKGNGVLLFSGHYGNWELIALLQGYLDMPLDMVVRELDNPYLERWLKINRTRSGNEVIHKDSSARRMLRTLKDGGGIAIMLDQKFRGENAVFTDFFGKPVATAPTLAIMALRTGAEIIPVFSYPREDGSYKIDYLPAVKYSETGNREKDIKNLTQKCTSIIEQKIREHPRCWLWMHNRFEIPAHLTEKLKEYKS